MGLARIIAPECFMSSDFKSKARVEVAKNLRDAMSAEDDDDDGTGVCVICVEVPDAHWVVGGNILPLRELINKIGGYVSEERKREMKTLFDGQAALEAHFGIPE